MADRRDTPIRASRSTNDVSRPSVMVVGQRSLATQRRGRYVAGSTAHPARMAPDLAAAVIGDYTEPGDLVLDPFAGIGTTLVEAVHAGRNAVGVEIERGWTALARANLRLATGQGAVGHGRVIRADANRLPAGTPVELRGQVQLVLTALPNTRTMTGVKHVEGITAVLVGCVPLLAPTGVIVVVARASRRGELLVDTSGLVVTAAGAVGLALADRRIAIHAQLRDEEIVARPTLRRYDDILVMIPTNARRPRTWHPLPGV